MIEKILNQIGLGDKEIKVYKLLLEYGKLTAGSLSRFSGIQRTTVYSVLKELETKGLVIQDVGKASTYFLPTPVSELGKIIEKEKEKLEEKKRAIAELGEILKETHGTKYHSTPKIRFIEESDIEQYLTEAVKRWYQSMGESSETWWGFQDVSFVGKFEKWIDYSWGIAPDRMNLKLLTNFDEGEEKMKYKKYSLRRKLKRLQTTEFTATQWVIGDYVIYIQTSLHPYSLVEIHDAVLAHNTREMFKLFWK